MTHPNFNPYSVLGLGGLGAGGAGGQQVIGYNPYTGQPILGGPEASRGMISQGYHPMMGLGMPPAGGFPHGLHPMQTMHPGLASNPILQQLMERQAAAHFPHMTSSQPQRKSGNSLGVNVAITLNGTTGYTAATFPAAGVAGAATQTLQSEFHGLKLSASAFYSGTYTPSGGGAAVNTYGQQAGQAASDVILQGVFVGGYNAQPLPPGTGISDGGVSLSAFPNNGLGNGIDMLPGKIGQVIKCPLLIQPSVLALFTIPSGATLTILTATVFLTFFGDNLQ